MNYNVKKERIMKLQFSIDGDGNYLIVETIMSATTTKQMRVRYSRDLLNKAVNDEQWRDTTDSDRDWFNKHYFDKFQFDKE
jgi:hypothetical protein